MGAVVSQESALNKWNGIQATSFTPRYINVSSKHVLSCFDDGNRVTFPITPAVKGTTSPAVSGGAVTQYPLRVQSNSRRQELIEVALIKCITSYYNWALPQIWKKRWKILHSEHDKCNLHRAFKGINLHWLLAIKAVEVHGFKFLIYQ